jgi:hypothetical protein
VTVEDRLRATTQAVTDAMRPVRPLDLPDERPVRARHGRRDRRWVTWGAPIAAAAVITALALVLVVLRGSPSPRPAAPAPAPVPPATASVPTYYAVLDHLSGAPSATRGVMVTDDRTGHALAVIPPPGPGQTFSGVTAAADDRTFVLSSYQASKRETTWYLLRITPGASPVSQLTRLPVKPLLAQPSGLALSPDGRELAVMVQGSSLQLETYAVSSGALLGTWDTNASYWIPRDGGANAFDLSWNADNRHLTFTFNAYAKNSITHLTTVRTLDVTAPGHDLLADSKLVLQLPVSQPTSAASLAVPCFNSLATPDGKSVICGTYVVAAQHPAACLTPPPSFATYSAVTGKQLKLRYPYPAWCPTELALPLWANSAGSQFIGLVSFTVNNTGPTLTVFGVMAPSRLTLFPAQDSGTASLTQAAGNPGSIAF